MRVFTVKNGNVKEGAKVRTFEGSSFEIPAIIVGEKGRGSDLGVLPVHLKREKYRAWKNNAVRLYIYNAEIGSTRSNRPKLIETDDGDDNNNIIVVFRTKIGFRGGNSHTGDEKEMYEALKYGKSRYYIKGLKAHTYYSPTEAKEILEKTKNKSGAPDDLKLNEIFKPAPTYEDFPGEEIVSGMISQGAAGRMGCGAQLVAKVPKGKVFRTGYSGRLYGKPSEHFYLWNGRKILVATKDEREIADLF